MKPNTVKAITILFIVIVGLSCITYNAISDKTPTLKSTKVKS